MTDDIAMFFIFYIKMHEGFLYIVIEEFKKQGGEAKKAMEQIEKEIKVVEKEDTSKKSQFNVYLAAAFIIGAIILPAIAMIYAIGFIGAYICTRYDPNIYLIEDKTEMIVKTLNNVSLSWIYVIMYFLFYRKKYLRLRKRIK
jgi:hypothetical protein